MDIIHAYIHYVNSIVKKYPHAVHKYLHCLHVRAKKGTEVPPAGKTVKFKFLGTGIISVMPVPLLAAHPRECSTQGRTRYVPSVCACRWTCPVHLHIPSCAILAFIKLSSLSSTKNLTCIGRLRFLLSGIIRPLCISVFLS